MGHDIFISYSSKDKRFADALVERLENEKLRCWYAPRDIPAGVDLSSAIRQAIEQIPVMLLVFSESASVSEDVSREVTLAFNQKRLVIPVRIENVAPGGAFERHLADGHWLDVYDMELEAALTKAVEGIKRYSAISVVLQPTSEPPLELRVSGKPYLIRLFVALFFAAVAIAVSFVVERWN